MLLLHLGAFKFNYINCVSVFSCTVSIYHCFKLGNMLLICANVFIVPNYSHEYLSSL